MASNVAVKLINNPSQKLGPNKRTGICQSCEWFKESPITRWQFAIFLLFAVSSIIWILIRIGSPITGLSPLTLSNSVSNNNYHLTNSYPICIFFFVLFS